MHIVLALLGGIVTVLFLLDRLGVDIGWLNPFHWRRRRAWARRYHGDPVYSVDDPVQLAALFVVGAIKLDGDSTTEQKQNALGCFADAGAARLWRDAARDARTGRAPTGHLGLARRPVTVPAPRNAAGQASLMSSSKSMLPRVAWL